MVWIGVEAVEFSLDEMMQLRIQAEGIARARGYESIAEDYGSFVTEYLVQGKDVHLKLRFYDFLGEWFGDMKTIKGELRALAQLHNQPLHLVGDGEIGFEPEDLRRNEHRCLELAHELKLVHPERAVFILRFQYGLNQRETGQVLGFSESRTNQIEVIIRDRLSRHLKMKDLS